MKQVETRHDATATDVAELTATFADAFGCRELGGQIGCAYELAAQDGPQEQAALDLLARGFWQGAYVLAGCESGLPDGGTDADPVDESTLAVRLRHPENMGATENTEMAPHLPERLLWRRTQQDLVYSNAFATRMLCSCLVDAIGLNTEGGEQHAPSDMTALAVMLETHLEQADARVDACRAAALEAPGLFTLGAVHGTDTLVLAFFAVNHAAAHGKRRAIFVHPHALAVERAAESLREIFGSDAVFKHRSTPGDLSAEEYPLTSGERWDSPLIVTTSADFFESLHAAAPARLAKLHDIAESVIVLDMPERLPVGYTLPCVRALVELMQAYGCTVLLRTSTSSLTPLFSEYGLVAREITSDASESQHESVTYEYAGLLSDEDICERMAATSQVVCIVNSREQAHDVYKMLAARGVSGIYHLSTYMYSVHREAVLAAIHERLRAGRSVRIIATSVVEYGLDLQVPQVLRAVSGVDSIQRAGELATKSVLLFEAAPSVREPDEIATRTALTRSVVRELDGGYAEVGSAKAAERYFHLLYRLQGNDLDTHGILHALGRCSTCLDGRALSIPFATVSRAFRLFEDGAACVLIPDRRVTHEVRALLQGRATEHDLARLSRYAVSVYGRELKRLLGAQSADETAGKLYLLRTSALYDRRIGLDTERIGK